MKRLFNKFFPEKSDGRSQLFLSDYPEQSRYAEAFRTLRTNINFSFIEKKFRSILITSAGQEEGKTTTAMNLAYTMAKAGRSTLMIDADLRRPALSRVIPSQGTYGLSELITNVFSTDIRKGPLEDFGIGDLLNLASFQKKTGVLHLSSVSEKKELELFFFQGELVDLNWLNRPKKDRLISVLINNGMLTNEQAKLAIERGKIADQKLGMLLISMGLVNEKDLNTALSIHMEEGLRIALNMKKGKFRFKDMPESDFEGPAFNPVDFSKLYKNLVVGKEDLPFLQENIRSAITRTDLETLSILPSGFQPPNPSELLGSRRMSFLISFLKNRFDVLVIDSPPLLPASDALLLSSHADGVVMVVKAGMMNWKPLKNVVNQLQNAQANLIGIALNQVDIKKESYYNYYDKYYSDYYGGDK